MLGERWDRGSVQHRSVCAKGQRSLEPPGASSGVVVAQGDAPTAEYAAGHPANAEGFAPSGALQTAGTCSSARRPAPAAAALPPPGSAVPPGLASRGRAHLTPSPPPRQG